VRLTEPDNLSRTHPTLFMEHTMNAKNIIAAAAIFAATGSAFAQGNSEFVEFSDFVSTRTRAEVQAEAAQAAATPEFVEFTKFASTTPRARAIAETRAASRATSQQGQIAGASEFVEHVNIASTRTRAEVRDEVLQAAKPSRTSIGG
jgi:activator of 2-hydroxyglutaryl-CoA dehydratase